MNTNNGWKLVPVVPTEEMLVALGGMGWMVQQKPESYAAMLTAAPEAPPLTVTVDPDPRGVSVGVYQGSSCVYNGAHPIPTGATGEEKDGLAEAQRLAQALFQRHFSQDDDYVSGRVKWEVLDDLPGVLSQIDNMVSGLVQPAAPAAGDAQLLAALQQAHMALIGFMPQHRNAVIIDAIVAARQAIDAVIAQQKGEA